MICFFNSQLIFLLWFLVSYGYCELSDYIKILNDKTDVSTIRRIDYMYVINLDHRKQKYQKTLDQLAPYGIIPYRLSAVNGWKLPLEAVRDVALVFEKGMKPGGMGTVYRRDPENQKEYMSHEIVDEIGTPYLVHCSSKGMIGCILSHLTAINDALSSGYDIIWICEDDIEVVRDPNILSDYIDDLDKLVGCDNWDILFTFCDYRGPDGKYCVPHGANYRPNIETRYQETFNINQPISNELRRVGSRFGTQSMILTRVGMKKILDFYKNYKIYMPYDLDLVLIPNIKIYSVLKDVVTNMLDVQSDLGSSNQSE